MQHIMHVINSKIVTTMLNIATYLELLELFNVILNDKGDLVYSSFNKAKKKFYNFLNNLFLYFLQFFEFYLHYCL